MKTSFQSPCLFSALSQAIVICFEKNPKKYTDKHENDFILDRVFGARHRGFSLKGLSRKACG